jgi:cytochrome c
MNKQALTVSSLLLYALLALPGSAWAAGDASAGADSFDTECGDCHSLKPGKNKKGPGLNGIVGRKAGSVADFGGYSDAMKASGVVWTADRIADYIRNPKAFMPGGKMKYDGLADDKARADIGAFLQSAR